MISHSHLDHTCSLPFLIDNNFSAPGFTLRIYAIPEVIASMKNHLFNNHTWPDFTCLPNDLTPVLKLIEVPAEVPFRVNGLSIRPVEVDHIVPTTGFIVEDKTGSVAYSSDTAPTDRFWELVNETRNLKAVITETSFPNELQDLANVSGHMTPQTLDLELRQAEARRARLPLRLQAAAHEAASTSRSGRSGAGTLSFLEQGRRTASRRACVATRHGLRRRGLDLQPAEAEQAAGHSDHHAAHDEQQRRGSPGGERASGRAGRTRRARARASRSAPHSSSEASRPPSPPCSMPSATNGPLT